MWIRCSTVALALACASFCPGQDTDIGPDHATWQPHRALKVLYAGKAGGHREQAFASFLGRWFDVSRTLPLEQLSMATAADWDVVIVDWVSQYGNDGYPQRKGSLNSAPVRLGADFTKPTIAMTYVGTQVRPDQKLDWL